MRRHWLWSAAVLVCLLGVSAAPAPTAAGSDTCHVRNVSQDTRSHSLRRMVRAAQAGDRLWLRGTCLGDVVIGKDLTISGVGGDAVVTGVGRYRVFRIREGATVTLRTLVISDGVGVYDGKRGGGGGVYNEGTLTLAHVIVRRATAGEDPGGAIANHGRLTVRDTIVRRSRADWGGGIGNLGSLLLVRSQVVANMPEGIWSTGPMTIRDSVVRDNAWGGLEVRGTDEVTITGTRVKDNRRGGGLEKVGGGTLTLEACVVAGNTSRGDGGGIGARGGELRLVGTTITRNTAAGHGGGVFVEDGRTTVIIDAGTRVAGNTPDDCYGTSAC